MAAAILIQAYCNGGYRELSFVLLRVFVEEILSLFAERGGFTLLPQWKSARGQERAPCESHLLPEFRP